MGACERERNSNKRRTRGTIQIQGYGRNRKESESGENGPSVMPPSNTSSALDHLARRKLYNGEDHTFTGVQSVSHRLMGGKER